MAAIDWGPSRSNAPNIVEIHNSFCHFANLVQLHNFRANGLVKQAIRVLIRIPAIKLTQLGYNIF